MEDMKNPHASYKDEPCPFCHGTLVECQKHWGSGRACCQPCEHGKDIRFTVEPSESGKSFWIVEEGSGLRVKNYAIRRHAQNALVETMK